MSWPPLATLSSAHATIQGQFCLLSSPIPAGLTIEYFLTVQACLWVLSSPAREKPEMLH